MSPKKPHWEKPLKKEKSPTEKVAAEKPSVAAPTSSWTPPWKTYKEVTFHILKNYKNEDFLKKAAAHFGVEYSPDFDALSTAIFDKAQHSF